MYHTVGIHDRAFRIHEISLKSFRDNRQIRLKEEEDRKKPLQNFESRFGHRESRQRHSNISRSRLTSRWWPIAGANNRIVLTMPSHWELHRALHRMLLHRFLIERFLIECFFDERSFTAFSLSTSPKNSQMPKENWEILVRNVRAVFCLKSFQRAPKDSDWV